MERLAVGFRVHGNRRDAHFAESPHDADGDLAPVCNQNLREHGARTLGDRNYAERPVSKNGPVRRAAALAFTVSFLTAAPAVHAAVRTHRCPDDPAGRCGTLKVP